MQTTYLRLIIPGYLFFVLMLLNLSLNAAENSSVINIENTHVKDYNYKTAKTDKGFVKKFARKVKTGIVNAYRKVINKKKRIFSKRRSKKDRMRANFKDRRGNLFNVLLFSFIFIAATALIVFGSLYLYLNLGLIIGLYLLYILGIALLLSAFVISLIYFSNRFILKPKFRS